MNANGGRARKMTEAVPEQWGNGVDMACSGKVGDDVAPKGSANFKWSSRFQFVVLVTFAVMSPGMICCKYGTRNQAAMKKFLLRRSLTCQVLLGRWVNHLLI